jgi:nuclear pore complex protein Nup214
MIHILATNGTLVSFNFMNLSANYVDICSPPRPIDNSVIGQFQSINISKSLPAAPELATSAPVTSTPAPVNPFDL